ncbi:Peptidyl-prolyl cis-trans isomerase [Hondaea fermentalgiana]|uniref:Peptidyl-prolyl cis-trans isomerase n=1 Tax=Hondaea fermentalgiana TaxID=2315210 RepID=A0A2R5GQQ7_9STRA|nr:Peptidyl-prolyl cis-trans isomerase [Hondaea fermentalgiana]|eukprot:GBG33212.1 Peptidyl-prolyl cis-trans isomerase [Hondaea fermentalgiana]
MSTTSCNLVVAGRVDDPCFQAAQSHAEQLAHEQANVTVDVRPMFGTDWEVFVATKSRELGVEHTSSPLVFYNKHHYIGDVHDLATWAVKVYDFQRVLDTSNFEGDAHSHLHAMMDATGHTFCYLDVLATASPHASIDKDEEGKQSSPDHECKECKENAEEKNPGAPSASGSRHRVVIELYDDICPNTCDNFVLLCQENNDAQGYKGSSFHRVVEGGWVQGGDVVDGSGKHSVAAIDKSGRFPDETFAIKHDRAGVVSMASEGKPHTNGSQFFVTLAPLKWLDCKRVAFGRVVYGMDAFFAIEGMPRKNERPMGRCEITSCGIFTRKERLSIDA